MSTPIESNAVSTATHAIAVLERPQLLEHLRLLERRRRQRRERHQELAAVHVQADVLERAAQWPLRRHHGGPGIGAREK